MPIQPSDLRVFRAATNNDTVANGGEISTVESVTNVSGNLFPRVSMSERNDGLTRLRKAFHRVNNADSLRLYDAHLFMFRHTPAVDAVTFVQGSNVNTQGDIVLASATHYGAGTLVNSVSAGAQQIEVMPEQAAYEVFRNGDRLYLTNKTTYEGVGDEEYASITGVADGVGGSKVLDLYSPLLYSYTNAAGRVASVLDHGDVQTSASIESVSVAGSGALSIGSFSVRQRGCLFDQVTFTFTSATNFNATSAKVGSLGSGTTGSTFAPINPGTASAYFSVPSSAWSGTFANDDVVVVNTVPAILPVFYVQQVPPLSPAFSGNSFTMVFAGETE